MPDCVFVVRLDVPGRIKAGKQFTVSVQPPLAPGCALLKVEINGQAVTPGYGVGDLKAVGFTSSGEVTLEALRDDPYGIVAIEIRCPGCGPTKEEVQIGFDIRKGCLGLSKKQWENVLRAIGDALRKRRG